MKCYLFPFHIISSFLLLLLSVSCASQDAFEIKYLNDGSRFRSEILKAIDSDSASSKISNTKMLSVFDFKIFITQCDSVNAAIVVQSKSQNKLLWIHEMSMIKNGIAVFSSDPNIYVLSIPYMIQVPGSEVWADDKLFFQVQKDTVFQLKSVLKKGDAQRRIIFQEAFLK